MSDPTPQQVREQLVQDHSKLKGLAKSYQDRWDEAGENKSEALQSDLVSSFHREEAELRERILMAVSSDLAVRQGKQKMQAVDVWVSTYRTQGFGADKYAREKANLIGLELSEHGIKHEVEPWSEEDGTKGGYKVFVFVEDVSDLILAMSRPVWDVVEGVRQCWKHGVNPRVYNPKLPIGLEKQNGIDYYGNKH